MSWLTTTSILSDLRSDPHAAAWRMLIERFRGSAVRFAISMRHTAPDAEDVAQEALASFAAAYRAGRYLREKGRLSDWLFGFVYRASLHAHSAGNKVRPVGGASFFDRLPEGNARPDESLESAWEGFLLQECLERARRELTKQTIEAFELTAIRDVSASEAAERLGVPITVIYNAKHRVARRLRELREIMEGSPAAFQGEGSRAGRSF